MIDTVFIIRIFDRGFVKALTPPIRLKIDQFDIVTPIVVKTCVNISKGIKNEQ